MNRCQCCQQIKPMLPIDEAKTINLAAKRNKWKNKHPTHDTRNKVYSSVRERERDTGSISRNTYVQYKNIGHFRI